MRTVAHAYALRKRDGDFGVEIELEGEGLFNVTESISHGWLAEHDGSLRGDAYEYVFNGPCNYGEAMERIHELNSLCARYATVFDSGRAGVHVHINVQKLTIPQVYNMVVLYLIFEDVLTDMCGEWRDGNLFCLRTKDAEGLLDYLRRGAETRSLQPLQTDAVRYAALNLNSIGRYGSVEFRAMRSTTDPQVLSDWMLALRGLRDAAMLFDNPQQIISAFSGGPRQLYDKCFEAVPNVVAYDLPGMYEGARRAQYVAYAVEDWDELAEFREKIEILRNRNLDKLEGWRWYDEIILLLGNGGEEIYLIDPDTCGTVLDVAIEKTELKKGKGFNPDQLIRDDLGRMDLQAAINILQGNQPNDHIVPEEPF